MGITDMIGGFIGMLLYPIFSIVFLAVDGLQSVFFAFAGIGSMSYGDNAFKLDTITSGNSGKENDTGIVYYLMNNEIVKNLLLSIMLLALFLIIIFTVMAFIKNAYAAKKGWKEIVGNSIKGLANFIFLPICCLLGVWLGNILLQAINGATSSGGATAMSRKLFIAAAYNANSCRSMSDSEAEEFFFNRVDNLKATGANYTDGSELSWNFKKGQTAEYYANCIDQIYGGTNISIYEWGTVEIGYSLIQINYLVIIVGGIFMLYVLGSLCFAMVRRIFFLLMLFVISPGICAMYPLDEGKAVGQWSGEVKKLVLSAYGAVAGMNIFFSLLPLVNNLHLGTGAGAVFSAILLDDLLQLFIMVSGLLVVKELISTISNLVGGEDAYSKGSSLMKSTAGAMKKYGGGAIKAGAKFVGGVAARKQGRYGAKGFFSAVGGQMLDSAKGLGLKSLSAVTGGAVDPKEIKKSYNDGKKEAADSMQDYDTRSREVRGNDADALRKFIESFNGAKIDDDKASQFINSLTSKEAKKEADAAIVGHNNAFDKVLKKSTGQGEGLHKEGEYLEKAKQAKEDAKKAQEEQQKEQDEKNKKKANSDENIGALAGLIQAQLKELKAIKKQFADGLDLKTTSSEALSKSFAGEIDKGKFTPTGGRGMSMLGKDVLKERAASGTEYSPKEISMATGEAREMMLKFNDTLRNVEAFKEAKNALKDSIKEIGDAAKQGSKNLEVPVPDISGLEKSLSRLGKKFDETVDKLKKFEDIK